MGHSQHRNESCPTGRLGRQVCRLSSWGLPAACAGLWCIAIALAAGADPGATVLAVTTASAATLLVSGAIHLRLLPSYRVFRCRPMGRAMALLLAAAGAALAIALHPATIRSQLSHFELHLGVVSGLVALVTTVAAILMACIAAGEAWEERRQERQWTGHHRSPSRWRSPEAPESETFRSADG